ncbi:MAG: YidB family protein [Asticcacaulis sp.]
MGLFDSVMNASGGEGGMDLQKLASQFGDGGLENIVAKFQEGGMGEVVQSWIGTGGNLPVSTAQIEAVLGSAPVQNIAKSMGIDTTQVAAALPGLIDKLTPNGQLPQGGIGDVLGQAMSKGGLGGMLGGMMKG